MKLVTAGDFAAIARAGVKPLPDLAVCRDLTGSSQPGANGRTIRYILSDQSVGRDGHIIFADAWQLANYRANPVFLWAHDSDQLPIGRMVEIGTVGERLMGTVQFPDEGSQPFADTVFDLFRSGYLNATSAGWQPLEWTFSKDRNRVGGIDFLKVDALEFSAVPVPALPTALVTARSAGINTKPLYDWAEKILDGHGDQVVIPRSELETLRRAAKMPTLKTRAASENWTVGAERDLPIDDNDSWDGPAAAERMLDDAGFNGDSPDSAKARRGFLVYDAANETLKGSYKLPFADLVDGALKAVVGGIRAAASRLPQTDIPSDTQDQARAVLDAYEKKAGIGDDASSSGGDASSSGRKFDAAARKAFVAKIRGLYTVGWLAMFLEDLADIQSMTEWETAIEEDDSDIPARIAAVLQTLGQILVDMTAEEVAELIAGDDVEVGDGDASDTPDSVMLAKAKTPAQRLIVAMARATRRAATEGAPPVTIAAGLVPINQARAAQALPALTEDEVLQPPVPPAVSIGLEGARLVADALNRAGRVLSADNEATLRSAHGMMRSACDMVIGVCDQAGAAPADGDQGGNAGNTSSSSASTGSAGGSGDMPTVVEMPLDAAAQARARRAKARRLQLEDKIAVAGE